MEKFPYYDCYVHGRSTVRAYALGRFLFASPIRFVVMKSDRYRHQITHRFVAGSVLRGHYYFVEGQYYE